MSSATTASAYEQACARRRQKAPDGDQIVTHAFASSSVFGPAWAVSGGQER